MLIYFILTKAFAWKGISVSKFLENESELRQGLREISWGNMTNEVFLKVRFIWTNKINYAKGMRLVWTEAGYT